MAVHTRAAGRFLEAQPRAVLRPRSRAATLRSSHEPAQRLVTTTLLPLKEEAVRSGFKRANYLSVVFRQQPGLPPAEYRQRFRQAQRAGLRATPNAQG